MHWARHLVVGWLLVGVTVPLASAQRQPERAPRVDERGGVRRAAPGAPGQLGVQVASEQGGPVRVDGFAAGSPAERAGMRPGDRIVAVEGLPVGSVDRLVDLVRSRTAGTELKLRLRRTVELRLDERQRTDDGRLALGLVLGGEERGLQVSSAPPGYAGAAAGIVAGDRVVELDGVALSNQGQLVEHMRKLGAARVVRVTFERDLRVRLGSADVRVAELDPGERGVRQRRGAAVLERPDARQDIAAEVAALRRELAALRAELAELRKVLADD